MILITSAAYINPGLITEFGKLPPVMLPVQNKRLFQHQLELFSRNDKIFLSLPNDFILSIRDSKVLRERNVEIVYIPSGFSLGQSIVYVLNVVGNYNDPLKILHGDTLFSDLPDQLDLCMIAKAQDNYNWAFSNTDDFDRVYAGYFSFSNQSLLIKMITENCYNFIEGVKSYRNVIQMNELETDSWLDFGLVNTFFRSKSKLTTERAFNNLKISRFSVFKNSKDKSKILAEAYWLKNLPANLKPFAPNLWDFGETENDAFYEIEYFYLSTLSDLFVFCNHPLFIWKKILESCKLFLDNCAAYTPINIDYVNDQSKKLLTEKTVFRLNQYMNENNIADNTNWCINGTYVPSLRIIVEETNALINCYDKNTLCIIHGDFCFSNILYNFKTQSIKVIDPRGINFDNKPCIYGDIRYDIAKLAHSVLGLYDYIIAGWYTLHIKESYNYNFEIHTEPTIKEIQDYFLTLTFNDLNLNQLCVYPIIINLFLSMLPLHKDQPERQKALLANALRLYVEFKELDK